LSGNFFAIASLLRQVIMYYWLPSTVSAVKRQSGETSKVATTGFRASFSKM
jgi:hypothetical protein